jgi:hypothetical protein
MFIEFYFKLLKCAINIKIIDENYIKINMKNIINILKDN